MQDERLSGDSNEGERHIIGYLLDVDYLTVDNRTTIRITVRDKERAYEIFDTGFRPYFYLVPEEGVSVDLISGISINEFGEDMGPTEVIKEKKSIFGKEVETFRVYVQKPAHVPRLSSRLRDYGTTYEYDIPFAKRYLVDKSIEPFEFYDFRVADVNGKLALKDFSRREDIHDVESSQINVLCFDIETYSPTEMPRASSDPVIMLSYSYVSNGENGNGVITFKRIDREFVKYVEDERALFEEFMSMLDKLDIDVITGYNSANFDVRYMIDRAKTLKIPFDMNRFVGETKIERHGIFDRVKIAGRVHVDMYVVARFIAVVGAAESILKLNSYTLKNVYRAVSKDEKMMVDRANIYNMWDGSQSDLETLAEYNLGDSKALHTVYDAFIQIMIELSRTSGNSLSDICVSTTGQIVEFLLMRYARIFGELIPNRPNEGAIRRRLSEPIEGAYVKTPDPGIYEKLAVFDFRSMYPSIIISHNIDPSSLCTDCDDYHESPLGYKFSKTRKAIIPTILHILMDARVEVKKRYKKDKDNITLGSRSQALKIISNAFYGYLGYARSRWYSRECASSVTAYERRYIQDTIATAEKEGFRVIYGDTDSMVLVLNSKSQEEASAFVEKFNDKLPESMNLELEDFYRRGIFVGKKVEQSTTGAKKKYALITYNGYIKIRGFELVRRDWSRIARDTQRMVLEAILNEGKEESAIDIVRDTIDRLKSGNVPKEELEIRSQLRKNLDSYDTKSPEVMAVRKAVESGRKSQSEMEHTVVSYVITRHGATISDKATLTEFATDYDPDYYINNQIIPATMRILKEMNFTVEELKGLGKQKKL